jgi:predicted ester cyclase
MDAAPSLIRHFLDQAFNDGNLLIVDDLVSADAITHLSSWGVPANRLGLKQMIATIRTAFPDIHCTIEGEIQADDKVAAIWTMRGSHKGSFLGNQTTGRAVEVQGFTHCQQKSDRGHHQGINLVKNTSPDTSKASGCTLTETTNLRKRRRGD